MLELKTEAERERVFVECTMRWRSEDEVTSREMRKMLRRKMTRLSLAHLNQVDACWRRHSKNRFVWWSAEEPETCNILVSRTRDGLEIPGWCFPITNILILVYGLLRRDACA